MSRRTMRTVRRGITAGLTRLDNDASPCIVRCCCSRLAGGLCWCKYVGISAE